VITDRQESSSEPRARPRVLLTLISGLGGKRLELLKEVIGNVTRVAVLYDPSNPGIAREVKEDFLVAARAMKLNLQLWEVRVADDFDRVFAATGKQIGLTIPPEVLARANRLIK
jgi:ABC-type uncharacterized transport system substrate-binding protein